MRFPNTLFTRTSLTISGALLLFMLFTGFVILNYILLPVGKQSASDLAALIVLSAKTWAELPPQSREDFQTELRTQHKLILTPEPPEGNLEPLVLHSPYMLFLEEALSSRMHENLHIQQTESIPNWFWAALPVAGHTLYIGLHHDHIGAEPPRAAIIILLGASLFILLTTLLVVRRITLPLEALSRGVMRLGSSGQHHPLPEAGPDELANLARKFNQLSSEIEQLLENRTILLGGISHDLRTPLARLGIVVELLENKADPELLGNMRRDLEEMDNLIARTLELARLMQGEEMQTETIDLGLLVRNLGAARSSEEMRIEVQSDHGCKVCVSPVILQRVLNNLLDNAILYSSQDSLRLRLECNEHSARICVLDRGPGIPADQLEKVCQPFYRLEPSRNINTGGSGLGLTIAQQLSQLNGWKIFLKNRASGGLSACVVIPFSDDAGAYG
jgi:two-component system osmolarity sensor histidine kinase EnvZ